ncbi:MucR family transcriptional regulator, partial [Heyndrickxia sporothermodurans]
MPLGIFDRAPNTRGTRVTNESIGQAPELTEVAVAIVAAYVSNNPVPASELPALIRNIHGVIAGLASGTVLGTAA